MTKPNLTGYSQEAGVFPTGQFQAWATADGMQALVLDTRGTRAVKRFKGETAWSDAVREAGDYNRQSAV